MKNDNGKLIEDGSRLKLNLLWYVFKNRFSLFQSEDIDGVPNDASGVSDSRETHPQQELFAIGGETEEQPPSNTLVADSSKPEEAPSAQQSSHLPEGNNCETCNCTKRTHMAYVNGVECLICGKVINLVVHESAPATSTSETETALSQTLVTGMVMVPHTPEPSPEDQSATSCEPVDQRALCGAGLDGSRIPIEGKYPVRSYSIR